MIYLFLLKTLFAASPDTSYADRSLEETLFLLQEQKEKHKDASIGIQMKELSSIFLGAEYIVDANGEEKEPDLDPLVRYDAFDCLTFVEEVLALSLASSKEEVSEIRKELRYSGKEIDYANRNHFMISQWLPNAIEKGYLKDITHEIGETHFVSKEITRQIWSRWRGRWKYPFALSQYPTGIYSFGVLSLDSAISNIESIPDGALIVVLRQNHSYNPIMITHLGFVVRHSEKDVRIRHATKMSGGMVKDHYLSWYLDYIRYFDKWPVEGVLVLAPQKPESEP